MKRYGTPVWILVSFLAVVGILVGLGSLLVGLFFPATLGTQTEMVKLTFDVGGLLVLGFSVMLLVTGWRGWKHRPSHSFQLPHGWIAPLILWSGLIVLILLVPGILRFPLLVAIFHLLLIILPVFFLLVLTALAAGAFQSRALRWREIVTALTGGALSTSVAFTLEVIGLLVSIILVVAIAMVVPGGPAEVDHLTVELQRLSEQAAGVIPEEQVLNLLASPVVLAVLVLTLAVATPLIEELGKTGIVAVLGYRERFDLRRAFLWGVTCGLGFAVVEGALNGLMSAGGPMAGWAAGIAMRALATTMHALTGGLVGLGWGYVWQQRRRWMLPLLYLGAVFFHGLWNLSAIGIVAGSLQALGENTGLLGGIVVVLGGGTLLVLSLIAPGGLLITALWLRRRASQSQTTTEIQEAR